VVGGEKTLVVDAGVRKSLADASEAFRVEAEHDLGANLGRHGVEPGDVDLLVLTHLHVDHSGLVDGFPNARLLVQRSELQYAAAPLHPVRFYDRVDIGKLVGPLFDRIDFVEGDVDVMDGVRCVFTGGHSPGHQMVYVDVPSGTAVITGDNVYLADRAMQEGIQPGYVVSLPQTIAAIDRIRRDADHVLPMHDAVVYERYPDGVE
jgi:glyoxylase-like metal-dependent hydrolase (beta-lactamase superfamily II)